MLEPEPRISRLRLAAFTLPVVLFQAIEMTWRTYMPRFLVQDVGIALEVVAILLLGARLLDAFADPIVGWLSDTVRTPYGLRKPWMIAGALLVPFGALPLFLAPPGAGVAYVVAASIVLHLGYSLIVTPHGGWGLELSRDSHQRTRIMGAKIWLGVLGSIGLLAALAVLERGFAMPLRLEMTLLGWAIAGLAPVTVLAVVLFFREREAGEGGTGDGAVPGPLALLGIMARQPAMRAVLLLYVLTGIADAAAAGSFLFVAEDALGLKGWGAGLLLLQPLLALGTLPLWSRFSARYGRQRTLVLAYGWQAITAPLLFVVPAGEPLALAGFLMLRALGWGVDYMLLRAIVADLAGQGALGSQRLGGSYYGVSSVTLKLAMGVGGACALWLIDLTGKAFGESSAGLAARIAYAGPLLLAALVALIVLASHKSARLRTAQNISA